MIRKILLIGVCVLILGSSAASSQLRGDTQAADTLTKCIISNMSTADHTSASADNQLMLYWAGTVEGMSCSTELNAWHKLCVESLRDSVGTSAQGCQNKEREIVDTAARTWTVNHPPPPESPKPRYVAVVARGLSVVPGALLCPNYNTTSKVFNLYTSHAEDAMQDAVTNNQSRLLREPMPKPNLKAYGCVLVPPGTSMTLDTHNVVPVVTVKLAKGVSAKGVTLPDMYTQK